jgi:hypothetical protein
VWIIDMVAPSSSTGLGRPKSRNHGERFLPGCFIESDDGLACMLLVELLVRFDHASRNLVGMEQMDAESVETVAGVARLLRRAAELAWSQADAAGPRSSRQLLALGIDSAVDEASCLLPRRARLDGPTPVGNDPAELLASAEQLLRRISVVGAPARLLGLRVLVAELVWEANTGAGA